MTSQSGGAGVPLTQAVAGVLSGNILAPAFATNGTDALLAIHSAVLGSDVTMTNANQFYDAVTIALTAGTWIVFGQVTLTLTSAGQNTTVKVWDGTTNYSSGNFSNAGAGAQVTLYVLCSVILAGSATIHLAAAGQFGGSVVRAAAQSNAAGNTATQLFAVRTA